MTDPLGLIHGTQNASRGGGTPSRVAADDGPNFKDVLLQNLNEANRAQQDATLAVEGLAEGKGDVENVVLAAKKAETAFQMLQALRNRVVEAYDEIKQMRV